MAQGWHGDSAKHAAAGRLGGLASAKARAVRLTCESCGKKKKDVHERECGYDADIHGTVRLETVCDDCEYQHCMDIYATS